MTHRGICILESGYTSGMLRIVMANCDIVMHDTWQVRFTQLAISGYQQILDYAASHPHHARQLEAEVIL